MYFGVLLIRPTKASYAYLLLLVFMVICMVGLFYSLNNYFLIYLLGQYRKGRIGIGVGRGEERGRQ